MSSYSEKLKDPRWQKKRLEILTRDNWVCQKCFDSENTLHVHHRSYRWGANPWDYDDKLLVTMCESCHADETENLKNEERALLDTLKMAGADSQQFNELMDSLADMRREPLNEPEWTMLCWYVRRLFDGRETSSGTYKQISDEFWKWLGKEREQFSRERNS